MYAEMEEYYATNKFFLSRIGGWPYQRKVLKVLLPCFLTIVQYSVIATEIILLHDTWGNVDIAVESVIIIIPIVGSNAKLINIIINNDKFRCLLRLMSDHWRIFNSESEHYILKYYADIGRKLTRYYAVYCCAILVLYLFIPLTPRILDIVIPLNESRPLKYVYQAEYRVDKEKYYYPILFHAYASSVITVGIVLSIDTTYIICVLHACSLFTAISHRLENIVGQTNVRTDNNEKIRARIHYHLFVERYDSIDDDYRELMLCLRKHQLALEFLINKLGHTEEVIRYICVTMSAFTHLVCMCFPGQLLIDRSTDVFDKAYSSGWYTFSIKSKKLLKILLYRSFVPCTLSAGNMFVMSMTMCSSVMQTALSYFTTLASMK
ncbi:hypothetical protein ACFW04_003687 [Cataglyphis niger]